MALQKQALFTLRQALALCEAAGIQITGSEGWPNPDVSVSPMSFGGSDNRLRQEHIDDCEREIERD